jgi:hypothetical protein
MDPNSLRLVAAPNALSKNWRQNWRQRPERNQPRQDKCLTGLIIFGARDQIRTGIAFEVFDLSYSLLALSSPFRWHALKRKAPNQKPSPSSGHKKSPLLFEERAFFVLEHETRFELATLTLARRTRNLLRARNRMGFQESWSGRFRQACALTGTHERALPC